MGWYSPSPQRAFYQTLPKVDLHRHLEGSLRFETLMEVVKVHGITLPLRPDLRSLVQMQPGEPLTSAIFLSKFQILRLFYRSPEIIRRVTREAVADAAADGVLYLDLHFTPVALGRYQGFPLADVMDWVTAAAMQAGQDYGIIVRLIASINRHESVDQAADVVRLAIERRSEGIAGLDLAGNEVDFPATPFIRMFCQAKDAGLAITVHAGEWGPPANVRQALLDFQADRINHGVHALEDPDTTALAREMGIPFAVCLTSNLQSGVAASAREHPIHNMLKAGLNVTINTDDPSISQIALTDEYLLACEEIGLSRMLLADRILAAARAALLSSAEREILVARLKQGLAPLMAG